MAKGVLPGFLEYAKGVIPLITPAAMSGRAPINRHNRRPNFKRCTGT